MSRVVALIRRLTAGPDGARAGALLGACDEAALRAGLALRAAGADLVVIAAGPAEREDEVLASALQSGADRALRVYDASLEGVDYHGVARVLAAATKRVGFDLVLIGDRSADEGQGAVGPAVAEALGVTHVTAAIDIAIEEESAAVVRRRDQAHVLTLRLPLPLVVTVARSPADPPPVTLRDGARIETVGLDELGIQAQELRHRLRCNGRTTPAGGAGAEVLAGADELIARLRERRLIP